MRIRYALVALVAIFGWTQESKATGPQLHSPIAAFSDVVHVQASGSQARLIKVIADLKTGNPDMNQFEPMLRIAIQQQKQRVDAYLAAAGNVTAITYVGPQNNGDVFQVTFDHATSAWWIQIAPNGNIAGLFFQ